MKILAQATFKICNSCGKEYRIPYCRRETSRYCSKTCSDKFTLIQKGQRLSTNTEFKKGHTYWLGKKRPGAKGNPLSLAKSAYRLKNELHPGWLGDKVGYSGLHTWLRRNFTKPKKCAFCKEEKELQWANKSHEYKRDINDWIALCRRCHSYYDREHGWGAAYKKFGRKDYL